MDFFKKGQEMLSGENNNQQQNTNQQAPQDGAAPAAGGSEDYGDKAFDFVSKKSGHTFDRNTSEKITDGVRGAYEKTTGNSVDAKYSN